MSIVTPLSSRRYYIIFGSGLAFIFLAIAQYFSLIPEIWFGFPIEFPILLLGCIFILIGLIGIRMIHKGIIL